MSGLDDVPAIRVREANDAPVRPERQWVLYWMTSARRTAWNFAIERSIAWALELEKPLVVLEAIRTDYPWACARFHRFVIDGMAEHADAFADNPVWYHPYVEPRVGAGRGLLEALAAEASVVVTDEFPAFFLPRMIAAAAVKVDVRLEQVDSNGLLPIRAAGKAFGFAHAFRRHLQKTLPSHLGQFPNATPFRGVTLPRLASLPDAITDRWPSTPIADLRAPETLIASLPIDHEVVSVSDRGGTAAAEVRMNAFLDRRLDVYHELRSHPDDEAASGLSLWLHFGQLSAHQIVAAVAARTEWSIEKLAPKPHGSRQGWWNASESADAFLDELVTWRELGFARCHYTDDFMSYDGLPEWSRSTLEKHANDPRPERYTFDELERAATSDPVWNAAQRQLVGEGRIQNYARMLWGKRVIGWTAHPREAFEILIRLNDKYAVDGRDPNSYTNIAWVFGGYDRPWAPERAIFGSVRYMTSDSAQKKLRMKKWLARWSGPSSTSGPLFR